MNRNQPVSSKKQSIIVKDLRTRKNPKGGVLGPLDMKIGTVGPLDSPKFGGIVVPTENPKFGGIVVPTENPKP